MSESRQSPEPLEADDAAILALESATIYGHTTKVLLLEPVSSGEPIGIADLRERVAARLERFPRLAQRVEMRNGDPADAWWIFADGFELDEHLTEHPGGPVDFEQLRQLTSDAMESRLDHARPLWQIEAVHLTEGRTALIARFHHCMADGVSAVKILSGLLFDEQEEGRVKDASAPKVGAVASKPPTGDSGASRRSRFEVVRTLFRELTPSRKTQLAQHISGSREVAWAETSLERVKRIGKAAGDGVTVNDVVLAAVGGSLDGWLAEGRRPKRLKAQVPVSLHSQDENEPIGNRDSFLFVDLPLNSPSPTERLRQINAETHERKTRHDAETLYDFFHAVGRFAPLRKASTRLSSGPREFALSVSNVPGPRGESAVLGREASGLVTLAEPADRHAVRIAIISIGDRITFGICSDPQAVEGTRLIANGIADALDQLEAELS